MLSRIDLSGEWEFLADEAMQGTGETVSGNKLTDTIVLPSTTAMAQKGRRNETKEKDYLTEEYKYEGAAWFCRSVDLGDSAAGKKLELFLERTRLTELWINGEYAGSRDSLCTPHIYDISRFASEPELRICIRVCNTGYPIKGGHMTSPDTQTNWNGITGEISLRISEQNGIRSIHAYPDAEKRQVELRYTLEGTDTADVNIWGTASDGTVLDNKICHLSGTEHSVTVELGDEAPLWSEHSPVIWTLKTAVCGSNDIHTVSFGLRSIRAEGMKLLLNGEQIFLRGKHDGMVFPLTGAAPTTVEEWSRVFSIAKDWGINHYRFHTCCPPEAAFTAADILGIYMQPELPYWGTVHSLDDEECDRAAQEYLIEEGRRIIEAYGDHPSFVMMSLGNELWGSPERINDILGEYCQDRRRLYTQGSNNFQFYPNLQPNDDFFSGVRLGKNRLIRGSYAMCDAPLGFVQTDIPNTVHSYDDLISPEAASVTTDEAGDIEIQYGTGVKKVHVENEKRPFVPDRPIVTHEVGQYCSYPDLDTVSDYTGVLKAGYLDIFRERLRAKGMEGLAEKFHMASGMLAFSCYKLEIEAAMRSEHISGFQLLDLQDFPGQCVAIVGMLDPLMREKRFVRRYDLRRKWLGFCSDIVILAEIDSFVVEVGQKLEIPVLVRNMSGKPLTGKRLAWSTDEEQEDIVIPDGFTGIGKVGTIEFTVPYSGKILLDIRMLDREGKLTDAPDAVNQYELYAYPGGNDAVLSGKTEKDGVSAYVTSELAEAERLLAQGERVMYLPNELAESIKGTYCTDFWCYPMFRSISESMGREVPVGTLGLLIDNEHPALSGFPSEFFSTPQWYQIVKHSESAVLDDTPAGYLPVVQVIDNFERNHKLGLLYEARVGKGKLLVCTSRLREVIGHPEVRAFARSLTEYILSDRFEPAFELTTEQLKLTKE